MYSPSCLSSPDSLSIAFLRLFFSSSFSSFGFPDSRSSMSASSSAVSNFVLISAILLFFRYYAITQVMLLLCSGYVFYLCLQVKCTSEKSITLLSNPALWNLSLGTSFEDTCPSGQMRILFIRVLLQARAAFSTVVLILWGRSRFCPKNRNSMVLWGSLGWKYYYKIWCIKLNYLMLILFFKIYHKIKSMSSSTVLVYFPSI